MVTISSEKRVNLLSNLVYGVFRFQELFTCIKEVNQPDVTPCVYAMWHAHQCCVHGVKNRDNLNMLISRSVDGEIIARTCERWGIRTVRGSKGKKGSVEATKSMIDKLKGGECCAITVDGPKGPARVVKKGVVKVAKLSGAPIVPVYWYSPSFTFLKFPSWDNFRVPFLKTNLINIYGEPIYVNPDNTEEQDEEVRLKVQKSLEELETLAPQAYKDTFKFRLWKKKN